MPAKVSKEKVKDWRVLEFYVPIEEKSVTPENDFIIRGIAINETTTLNNVKYVAEELEKAAVTFRNVPILLDHRNEVRNIVGRTTENVRFERGSDGLGRIPFEGKIMDKDIREMIKDGRIGSVSIGAKVQDLVEEEDGSMKAIGIQGLEISLVAVPGDSQASLAQAIQQGFVLKEMAKLDDELNLEEDKMEEEKPEAPVEETPEVKAEVKKEEPKVDTTQSEMVAMRKQIDELKELLIVKKKLTETKMVDSTKGEVSEKTDVNEALKSVDNRIVEAIGKGNYAMYRDYTRESADSKLKRLIR